MGIEVRKQGNTAILSLEGNLALGGALEDFRAGWSDALASGARDLIINFSRVHTLDSSGIGSLIRCHSRIVATGGKLKLVGASDNIRHVFRITRLDQVFEFHDSEEKALGSLAAAANQ